MQIVIALVVTPEGLPLAYEVLPGNTADKTTLRGFLERIERQYGKARRVWLMDPGVPTEEVLAEMRAADPPVHYLVGTPQGRLTRLEKHLVAQPWQEARPGVQVKLLPQQGELYVLAQSHDRVANELAAAGFLFSLAVAAAMACRVLWGWLGSFHVTSRLVMAGLALGMGGSIVLTGLFTAAWPTRG